MTIENNRLICEFYFGKQTNPEDRSPEWQLDYSLPIFDDYWEGIDVVTPENAQFTHSWDWLIPVITKITSIDEWDDYYPMNAANTDIALAVLSGDIDLAYAEIVDFIEWYNQQKSEQ